MNCEPDHPVVVIGAARSGTKWLRNLIASSGAFRVVPYDVNYIWKHGQQWCNHDELKPLSDQRHVEEIRRMLQRAAVPAAEAPESAPLLEKTVSNAIRIPLVLQVLPNARFIEIIRDGRQVAASTFRQWTSRIDRGYSLRKLRTVPLACWPYFMHLALRRYGVNGNLSTWGVRYAEIQQHLTTQCLFEVCALQWKACIRGAMSLGDLPTSRVRRVRYEDLCRSRTAVSELAAWLGVSESRICAAWEQNTTIGEDTFERTFSGKERSRLLEILEPELYRLGYC